MTHECSAGLLLVILFLVLMLAKPKRSQRRQRQMYSSGGTAYDPTLTMGAAVAGPLPSNASMVNRNPLYPFIPVNGAGFY